MRKNKVISFGLLIAAFVFFCNPNINVFDILPDALACLFVILAISRLGDLCDDLGEAKRAFITLLWINLSKLPAFIVVLWITGSNMNEGTMWLVLAFCYAVVDVVFAIRAFSQLFAGLAYLGTRNDGGEFIYMQVLRPEKQIKQKNGKIKTIPARIMRIESLSRFTSVFIAVKAVCCTLPEFVYIYRADEIDLSNPDLVRFRPHLYVLLSIVAVVFAVIWLCKMCRYTVHLAKYSEFWKHMTEQYREKVLPRKGIFIMRYVNVFAIIVSAAAFFSVDLYLDEINVIPDFISAILFFAASLVIAKYVDGAKWLKATSVIYFVTSLCTFVAMIMFKTGMFSPFGYYYHDVHTVQNAKRLYTIYVASNALTQIAFIAVMLATAAVMMKIVRMHTGMNTLTGVSSSFRPLDKVYGGRIVRMRVFSVITAIMSMLYFFLIVYAERIPLRDGRYVYMPKFEVVWMIDFVIGIIYAVHLSNIASDLVSEVNYKYKYE